MGPISPRRVGALCGGNLAHCAFSDNAPKTGQLLTMGSRQVLVAQPPTPTATGEPVLDAYRQEIKYVFHALRWLGAHPQEVEDLAQDVFIALRRAWPHYDSSRPIRPYLFGVAFRVVSMHRRKRRREVPLTNWEVRDGGPQPDEIVQAKQARAIVLRALETIPLRRRAILVMHELDGTPMGQVASALSLPLFTAYSRLRKARRELETSIRRLTRVAGKPRGP